MGERFEIAPATRYLYALALLHGSWLQARCDGADSRSFYPIIPIPKHTAGQSTTSKFL